ncbi:hypothetical protein IKQ21_09700 [bacterium]|nr:hypothetical protein [bacterium]
MNSKQHLYNEAERLYIYSNKGLEAIANELNLSRKTLMDWKEKGDWGERRKAYKQCKTAFHEELYDFARQLMKGIAEDMAAGEKVDTGRIYAFCRILPLFVKVKDYEDVAAKKADAFKPKGLTKEVIAQIEEEILGIPRKIETEDETDN